MAAGSSAGWQQYVQRLPYPLVVERALEGQERLPVAWLRRTDRKLLGQEAHDRLLCSWEHTMGAPPLDAQPQLERWARRRNTFKGGLRPAPRAVRVSVLTPYPQASWASNGRKRRTTHGSCYVRS